jgi:uncharacterized membrane protein
VPARNWLIAAALILGVAFRVYAIGAHGFWGDEGVTALHAAGYTYSDVIQALSGAAPVQAGTLDAFHRANVRGADAVVSALAHEDAGHPPLYYVLANWWERIVGSDALSLRILSVIFGLLVLPAMYWLALELFADRLVAGASAAVAAISPFNVEYAQQAREYSLWMLVACISSALLLRSLRSKTPLWPALYGVSVLLGLYTHTFFLLIVTAHAVYALALRKSFARDDVMRTGAALTIGVVLFLPWLWFVVHGYTSHDFGAYLGVSSTKSIIYAWGTALAAPLTDLELYRFGYFALAIIVLAIECTAVVSLVRSTPAAQWVLPCALIGTILLLQIAKPALVTMIRYWVPATIGIFLALGWWVGSLFRSMDTRRVVVATAALCFIVAAGSFDDVIRFRQSVWWTNAYGAPFAGVVKAIASRSDGAAPPVILGNTDDFEALEDLASLLPANTLVWIPDGRALPAPLQKRQIFVFTRFAKLATRTAAGRALVPIPVSYAVRGYGVIEVARHQSSAPEDTWLWSVRS